jgi:hypothetical protein
VRCLSLPAPPSSHLGRSVHHRRVPTIFNAAPYLETPRLRPTYSYSLQIHASCTCRRSLPCLRACVSQFRPSGGTFQISHGTQLYNLHACLQVKGVDRYEHGALLRTPAQIGSLEDHLHHSSMPIPNTIAKPACTPGQRHNCIAFPELTRLIHLPRPGDPRCDRSVGSATSR